MLDREHINMGHFFSEIRMNLHRANISTQKKTKSKKVSEIVDKTRRERGKRGREIEREMTTQN